MGASCAGSSRRLVWTLGSIAHGDVTGRKIDDGGGNEKGRNLAGAPVEQVRVLALDDIESADTRSDVHPDVLRIFGGDFQTGRFHSLITGGQRQVYEASHLLQFFFLDKIEGVEILDLGGNLAGKLGGIELGDAGSTALPSQQIAPGLLGGVAHGADRAEPGDDDATQTYLPPFECLPM